MFDFWTRPGLLPGSEEFVSWCPLPICIVSNIDRADLQAAIQHVGLSLPMTVTSEDVRAYKPRAELFQNGLELLQLQPHEVLHIGDSVTSDVAGANALGIDVAWVNSSGRVAPENVRIHHEVTALGELRCELQSSLS